MTATPPHPLIAPSILACDFARLGDEVRAVAAAGADVIHVDVMDGHFVPNLSIGVPVVAALRPITRLPLDCHLMIANPEAFIEPFARAGADWISVHVETCDPAVLLPAIRRLGCRAGLVLNPDTPVAHVLPHLAAADYILIMSVQPGFAGQRFISTALDTLRTLHAATRTMATPPQLEIDGGITTLNAKDVIAAGADILVAGNALFKSNDYRATIQALRAPPA